MTRDITTLARALMAGELEAAVPLYDALLEAGDARRAGALHANVGYLLESVRASEGKLLVREAESFRRTMASLFWTEADGRDDAIRAAGAEYARWIQAGQQQESRGTISLELPQGWTHTVTDGQDSPVATPQAGTTIVTSPYITHPYAVWLNGTGIRLAPGQTLAENAVTKGGGVIEQVDRENGRVLVRFPTHADVLNATNTEGEG